MKGRTLDFHSGKTVDLSILRARMQESPRTASARETPLGKKGRKSISCGTRLPFPRLILTVAWDCDNVTILGQSFLLGEWFCALPEILEIALTKPDQSDMIRGDGQRQSLQGIFS